MIVEVLGEVQEGGVPHLGCRCNTCSAARADAEKIRFGQSILLKKNHDEGSIRYMFGATGDVRFQTVGEIFDGIFPVDNHFTEPLGLLYLGEFSLEAENIPVYAPDFMQSYLESNEPYKYLIDRGNITLHSVEDGRRQDLQHSSVVPHRTVKRGKETGSYSYVIEGEDKTLYYVPVVYQEWTDEELERIRSADIAIVEGCFYGPEEVDRYSDQPPHPTMQSTMDALEGTDTEVYFTHMNHTNPVLDEGSEERREIENRGFHVAERGLEIEI